MVWRRETNKDTSTSIGTQGYKGQTCVCLIFAQFQDLESNFPPNPKSIYQTK
jgi:hypothetical protein